MKNLKKDNKGFSLVELLVVIAIMVVLVGVVAPSLLGNIEKSRESKDIQTLDAIAGAIQSAVAEEKGYDEIPTDKITLVKDLYTTSTYPNLSTIMTEYLSKPSISTSFDGKGIVKADMEIYFMYSSNGKITVFVADKDASGVGTATIPTAEHKAKDASPTKGILVGKKGTKYLVER